MRLTHLRREPSFVVEGHSYAGPDGREFVVFTAGDSSIWQAAERRADRSYGPYIVKGAFSQLECVRQLEEALA